jgi:hypothetical protein
MFKELKPIETGTNIADVRKHLETSGVLNGAWKAVQITEKVLTGDPERLMRKGKSINNICEYPAEQVIVVWNETVEQIETQKGVIKDTTITAYKVLLKVLGYFKIKLPFGLK